MQRSSQANAHHQAAEIQEPETVPLAERSHATPELIAPRGVVVSLDSQARFAEAPAGMRAAWSTEPHGRSRFHLADLHKNDQVTHGPEGVQAVAGTQVQYHYMAMDFDSDAVMTARFADRLELASLASYRHDGGIRLWVAEVHVDWTAGKEADTKQTTRVEIMPVAEFLSEDHLSRQPISTAAERIAAAEQLAKHLAGHQVDLQQLVAGERHNPFAGERIHLSAERAATTSSASDQEAAQAGRQLAAIAHQACSIYQSMPGLVLPPELHQVMVELKRLTVDGNGRVAAPFRVE